MENNIEYPHGFKLAAIMGSSYLSMFLVALVRLIVTIAVPEITDNFQSITNVGCVKVVFLASILAFEVGSAICGAAPNSTAWAAQRLFGAVFGLANVIAPLLGGAFTDSSATWRWCFYINLPIGGLSILFIGLLLEIPDRATTHAPSRQKLIQLDGPGVFTLLGGIALLLLALEWGGTKYAWSNGRIIALLIIAILLLLCFAAVQVTWPQNATVPPRIFTQRSILAASAAIFFTGASMMSTFYYLPIWFQAVQGTSAVESGIRLLPLVFGQVVGFLAGGIGIQKLGYYSCNIRRHIVGLDKLATEMVATI